MTLLQLVNKVLRRLREDEVAATNSTDYSRLVADFVADVHQEVCHADDWAAFEHTINVDVVIGQREYNLGAFVADGGDVPDSERVTTDQSMLIMDGAVCQAWLFDDASDDTGFLMERVSHETLEYMYQHGRLTDNSDPVTFSLVQHTDNGGYKLTLWPTPTATRRIRIRFYTPEAELETDSTDDATVIRAPTRPIYLGALYMCLNERGEEMGEPGNIAERRYIDALTAAKETNGERKGRTNSYEFYRD